MRFKIGNLDTFRDLLAHNPLYAPTHFLYHGSLDEVLKIEARDFII